MALSFLVPNIVEANTVKEETGIIMAAARGEIKPVKAA
jgi:hypothetical protein